METALGVRAVTRGGRAIAARAVFAHVQSKFKQQLRTACQWLWVLASIAPNPVWLDEHAYGIYTRIRPQVSETSRGWGKAGEFTSRTCQEELLYLQRLVSS